MLSFYDWYADLPVASPQVFGDQTDVPESADWWDAAYLMMWGSNVPVTRTPDAHWMAEARYRGQKVVVVAPDYADNVKFADEWLPAQPGTDGALAMAMGHVILREFFVDRDDAALRRLRDAATPTCRSWSRWSRATTGRTVPGKFLTAADLGQDRGRGRGVQDRWSGTTRPAAPAVPNGSLGFRCGESGAGRWNLDLGDDRAGTGLLTTGDETVEVLLPRFDDRRHRACCGAGCRSGGSAGHLVTTVFDLLLAQYGVGRPGLPGQLAGRPMRTPTQPYTPAWQEPITGVPAAAVRPDRPGVRRQRRAVRRPVDDPHGRRHATTGSTPTPSTGRCSR